MKIIEFNTPEDDFDRNVGEIEKAMKEPSVVLVWAVWCPHCTSMKEDWDKLKKTSRKTTNFIEIESGNLEKIKSTNKALFKKLYKQPDRVFYPMIQMRKNNTSKLYNKDRTFTEMKKSVDTHFKKAPKKATPKKKAQRGGGGEQDASASGMAKFQRELNDYIQGMLSKVL
jgi:thiol-disulfide isomerase/thioredoxin